ncbi:MULTISPECIES: hypothetical protein [Streptomyces]|uniref:hypothetical protein n=1 Tax=Streptomyces TaxID=1883 RepID=UPI001D09FE11|nr:hypothetical protein [Streptomyces longhuiensis]UDL97760.1 hypothetical protein LGI35_05550 [Streptomyces longhuiensis]
MSQDDGCAGLAMPQVVQAPPFGLLGGTVTAGIIDAQSVKAAAMEPAASRGFDAAS